MKLKLITAAVIFAGATLLTQQLLSARERLAETKIALERSEQRSEQLFSERQELMQAITQATLERDTERRRLRSLQQQLDQVRSEQAKQWKQEEIPDEIKAILNDK